MILWSNKTCFSLFNIQFCQQFIHHKWFVQASGKTMFQKLFTLHITTGSHSNHGYSLSLRNIRSTQQVQQVETIHGRHLHIGKQCIESIGAEGFQQFIQLQTRNRSDATLCKHSRSESELNTVVINQKKVNKWRIESGEWRVGCAIGGCAIMLHRTLNSQLSTLNFPNSHRIQRYPQRKRTPLSEHTIHFDTPFQQLHQHTDNR